MRFRFRAESWSEQSFSRVFSALFVIDGDQVEDET